MSQTKVLGVIEKEDDLTKTVKSSCYGNWILKGCMLKKKKKKREEKIYAPSGLITVVKHNC